MAGGLPYYKMYPKDFDTDGLVRAMNDEQRGFYLRCLNYSWLNDGLPADLSEIQIVMSDTKGSFSRKWPRVEPCFPIAEDGKRRNPRQEKERSKAIMKSEHNTNAVRTRYERRSNEPPRAYGSGSVSGFEVSSEGDARGSPPLPRGYALDEHYATFRELASPIGWITSDFTEAYTEWLSLDFEQRVAAIQGIKDRLDSGMDVSLIPRPRKYLQKREWQRKVAARKTSSGNTAAELAAL